MLSDIILNKLNGQLNKEYFSSYLYLQMSAWCQSKGYLGASKFLQHHSEEEMQHMQRFYAYITESGYMPELDEISKPQSIYSSFSDVFNIAFKHEKLITEEINQIAELSLSSKDFCTFNFIQWFIAEQHEEEKLFKIVIDKINLAQDNKQAIYSLDNELSTLTTSSILNKK